LTKAAAETGRMIGEKITAKEKERKAIEQEVDAIKKELQGLRSEENRTLEPTAKAFVQMQIANLEAQKRRLESRL
jgi:predicted  nucleic acid-binding Zn-ribbon protein